MDGNLLVDVSVVVPVINKKHRRQWINKAEDETGTMVRDNNDKLRLQYDEDIDITTMT